MKQTIVTVLACILGSLSLSAQAVDTEYVRVLASKPHYAVTSPRQVCFNEIERVATPQQYVQQSSGIGPVLGAVVGGVIGHQLGGGSGKVWATGAGAAIGAVAGQGSNQVVYGQPQYQQQVVTRCNVVPGDTVVTGYTLTVRYHGELTLIDTDRDYPVGYNIPITTNLSIVEQ